MENNKRCAIFSPSSFSGMKINGRRNFSRISKHSRFDYRIFSIFRVFAWASFWFCPCFFRSALAEFETTDSQNLSSIKSNVVLLERYVSQINTNVSGLETQLQNLNGKTETTRLNVRDILANSNTLLSVLGYGTSYAEINGTLKQDLTTINSTLETKLQAIIDALQNEGSGGSGGDTSLPIDIATETTLSAFKSQNHTDITAFQSKYEEFANQFLTSWGFVGGSDGTLKDLLESCFVAPAKDSIYPTLIMSEEGWDNVPFPVESHGWANYYRGWEKFSSNGNWLSVLSEIFAANLEGFGDGLTYNFQKSSWNDWYAHTNTLARLDMIVESLNSTPDISVNDTNDIGTVTDDKLNITFDKSTGDSPDSIDLHPAFTNDVAELSGPAHSITNKVAKLITYSKLSNRYKTPDVDNTNYRDYGVIQDIPDYNLQYGTRPQMRFSFTATARNLFRGFLSRERMATLRDIFLKLWAFLAIYCNFLIFKIFGKMGGNE